MSIEFAGAAKARELRTYFSRHGRIYIVVNATGDDVQVPDHLHGDPALRLVLNVRMPQQIMIGDDTFESDLTFSGTSYHCVIPMQAIWAAYVPEHQLENGILWEDDVPETIRTVVKAVRSMRDDVEISAQARAEALLPEDKKPADAQRETPSRGKKVGHLRVVK